MSDPTGSPQQGPEADVLLQWSGGTPSMGRHQIRQVETSVCP
jgi:hypothetical protein